MYTLLQVAFLRYLLTRGGRSAEGGRLEERLSRRAARRDLLLNLVGIVTYLMIVDIQRGTQYALRSRQSKDQGSRRVVYGKEDLRGVPKR